MADLEYSNIESLCKLDFDIDQ